jgi:hypothetical protein
MDDKGGDEMLKRTIVITALACTPVFAEQAPDPTALSKCQPIGQTIKGERIYGLDCQAINNVASTEFKPEMPSTNLKETVIPKPGKVQTPDTTPTKGETR